MKKRQFFVILFVFVFPFVQGIAGREELKTETIAIAGCSAAGISAAQYVAKHSPKSNVICISEENTSPYKKPAFKKVLKSTKDVDELELKIKKAPHLEFLTGKKIRHIDFKNKTIYFKNDILKFDKLLIATGRSPNKPRCFFDGCKICHNYHTREDLNLIKKALSDKPKKNIVILGAGIKAFEIADALKKRYPQKNLIMISRSNRFFGIGTQYEIYNNVKNMLHSNGISFFAVGERNLKLKELVNGRYSLEWEENSITPEIIINASGVSYNTEFLANTPLELNEDKSIKVNKLLMTNIKDVFAAGDVVGFVDSKREKFYNSSKWNDAEKMGIIAAKNMINKRKRAYRFKRAVHSSSFFGHKLLLGGSKCSSQTKIYQKSSDQIGYFVCYNDNIMEAFRLLYKKGALRPNWFFYRRAFMNENKVSLDQLKKAENPSALRKGYEIVNMVIARLFEKLFF